MNTDQETANTQDLVLIGGGHSHLAVIKQLAMQPVAGLRLTVISEAIHTPYSGMIPGLLAGHYSVDDAHIDLRKLCQFAGARLFHSSVTAIDLDQQLISCHNRPAVRYDWLSINSGSQPDLSAISGADNTGVPIKPIDGFLTHWQAVVKHLQQHSSGFRLAVVGGGAASVEVCLAIRYQLQQQLGEGARQVTISLLCGSETLLPSHNQRVQRRMTAKLAESNITLITNAKVLSAGPLGDHQQLQLENGKRFDVDEVIWTVHAGSPKWPEHSGLACDADGFISVNQYLQSLSHSNVFAAGDVAHFAPRPLPKSGVYAVRAGKRLSDNLRRAITGKALLEFKPQKQFLSLLMTGDKAAVASRGNFCISGPWVWRWKDAIDRKFMDSYRNLSVSDNQLSVTDSGQSEELLPTSRCGGCGAKIGHSVLQRVVSKLQVINNTDVIIGINTPDDAAVINPPAGKQWLQTVDYFRAFIDDPYLLGRIATNHCLSDIYAMGATPHSALAIATVPYASERLVEDTLLQLMSGAVDSLNQQGTSLIGGHSSEGSELSFGLAVNGTIEPQQLLTKTSLQQGELLVLTKPLGTGAILAANMQGAAEGRWIDNALEQMLISNQQAADILFQHQASACTDITGFGLLGHLNEMLQASELNVTLYLHKLPLLTGAIESIANGWRSSLHPDNQKADHTLQNSHDYRQHSHYPLLFDPQTAGGLLASIPATQAQACLEELQQHDCPHATVIGMITAPTEVKPQTFGQVWLQAE